MLRVARISERRLRANLAELGIAEEPQFIADSADEDERAALDHSALDHPALVDAVTLIGEVIAVKRVAHGAVSYGYSYRIERPTTLALVGLGYADGVPRRASNQARILLGGGQHLLAGRVAMDQLVVDLGDGGTADEVRPGDEAVLWGDPAVGAPGVKEWSRVSGRSPRALLAGLGPRIRRELAD